MSDVTYKKINYNKTINIGDTLIAFLLTKYFTTNYLEKSGCYRLYL